MKILIIGYGSIGKTHYNILKDFNKFENIDIVTKQSISSINSFKNIEDVEINEYDYFIIASKTVEHFFHLKYICDRVNGKKILVEKPLFDKSHVSINSNNKIYVAYNLRFHPIIQKINELICDDEIYYANIYCGQYLPTWRTNQDYRKSYSAKSDLGGGVLRDLSHEIDYATWLFGDFKVIKSINTKISDLEIESDDIFTAVVITGRKVILNISVDYISKMPMRNLLIHTKNKTIKADIINMELNIQNKDMTNSTIKIDKIDKSYTYKKMHKAVLDDIDTFLCSYKNGKNLMSMIDNIEFIKV